MSIYNILIMIFSMPEIALLVFRRSKNMAAKNQSDKRSLIAFWITIPLCLVIGGFVGANGVMARGQYQIWIYTGIAIFILGFIVRWVAIIQLGKMFTVDVAIASGHELKLTGLYKVVRHPSYLGLMLIIAGIALSTGSVSCCLIIIVPIFAALHYRMNVEEKALEGEFGSQYADYKAKTARLIPGLY